MTLLSYALTVYEGMLILVNVNDSSRSFWVLDDTFYVFFYIYLFQNVSFHVAVMRNVAGRQ